MLDQSLHLTLLDLIALQKGKTTTDSRSLAAIFMLLLPALLAKLLTNCPSKALAEVATESAITMKARSNMLGFGLVGELLHHLIEIFVIQLDLDLVALVATTSMTDGLAVARFTMASAAIDCLAVEMLGNRSPGPGSVIHTLERLAHAPVNSDIPLRVVIG